MQHHWLTGFRRIGRKFLPFLSLILVTALGASLLLLAYHWPFTRDKSVSRLEHFADSELRVGKFRQTFFPNPGYVAEDLLFTRDLRGRKVTMASIHTFTCRASWWTLILLRRQLKQIRISGLKVYIPAEIPEPTHLHPEEKLATTITEAIGDGAVVEFERKSGDGQPLRFTLPELVVKNAGGTNVTGVRAVVHIPEPSGTVNIEGTFGPVNAADIFQTPVAGRFQMDKADLGCFHPLSGLISGSGSLSGNLARLEVRGTTGIANFALSASHHEVALRSKFDAAVNGKNGDVAIDSAQVSYLNTSMEAHGSVSSEANKLGKTASFDVTAKQGRIEDLLRLFGKAESPSLMGAISFQTHATLPSGDQLFLRRIGLTGQFRMDRAQFLNLHTQSKVNELSAHGRGDKQQEEQPAEAAPVVFTFEAAVILRDGKANFSGTSFQLPGASATGAGTYGLITQAIDWRGTLAMRTDLSQATTGMKSWLLKPLSPLFRGKHAGAVLPIQIRGTYSHPSFELALKGKKRL